MPARSKARPAPAPKADGASRGRRPSRSPKPQRRSRRRRSPPRAAKPAANGHDDGERVFACPLARRMAQQAGVDLAALKGTGPHGRIVKADIDAALAGGPAPSRPPRRPRRQARAGRRARAASRRPPAPNAKQLADAFGIPYSEPTHNNMRKTIARRLTEVEADHPAFLPDGRLARSTRC